MTAMAAVTVLSVAGLASLGGYSIVEVPSLEEAVAIARDHPLVRVGRHSIEVRPVRELPRR
jgi:hypothetical protein